MEQINMFFSNPWVIFPLMVWSIFWKGIALWISSKNGQKKWFLVLLVLNTAGIIEIIYIFFITKKNWSDIKEVLGMSPTVKKE